MGHDNSNTMSKNVTKNINRVTILRRLNIVIKDTSDLSYFSINSCDFLLNILGSYDLVSLSATNDDSFVSICNTSSTFFDILTMDYTAGHNGVGLAHKLKSSDLAVAATHGVTFELLYSSAL